MDGVAGARWQDEEQLHLTLRFVGEVDRHRADDVAAALEGLSHPRFELALSGVGAFDRRGVAHALWAGVTPPEPVRALHHKVEQAVVRAGLDPEHRAYHPHITIARLGRGTGPLDAFMARHGGVTSAPFAVEDFCLYESNLTRNGAIYTILERYKLR
jgi:2'-5' RNA ligase